MSSYLVRAKKMFRDNPDKKTRKKNDEFTVDQERLDALQKASNSLIEVIEQVDASVSDDKEETVDETAEETPDVEADEETNEEEAETETETEVIEDVKSEEVETENVDKSDGNTKYPFHVGGPYFLLSNGEKVKGKEEAEKAEKEL